MDGSLADTAPDYIEQDNLEYVVPRLSRGHCLSVSLRDTRVSPVVQMVKNLPAVLETYVQSLGQKDPLEKGMVTHSGICAWRIPRKRNLAVYSPWGHKKQGHDGAANTFT